MSTYGEVFVRRVPLCQRCGRPFDAHLIFHDQPPDDLDLDEGQFAEAQWKGIYCPTLRER